MELEDGQVVWKYNLGDRTAEIRSTKSDYNDDRWHQVVASRQGPDGTLIVRTHKQPDDIQEGSTGGKYNQLDLAPQATKIFAAGAPDGFLLPVAIKSRRFIGGLDDFSYSENQIRLGLWNFVDGVANDGGLSLSRTLHLLPAASARLLRLLIRCVCSSAESAHPLRLLIRCVCFPWSSVQ